MKSSNNWMRSGLMFAIGTVCIGGVGTYTPLDSQPCRLLQCKRHHADTPTGSAS